MATWGQQRQWMVISIGILVLLVIVGAITSLVLYKPPMCTDGKQNGTETGIDCGGPCPNFCAAALSQPSATFALPLVPEPGRTDVIAYIPNTNAMAGVPHARYTLELLGSTGSLITQRTGTINLPPDTTAPLYIPNAYDGSKVVAQAFLTLDPQSLVFPQNYQKPTLPRADSTRLLNGQSSSPKIEARLVNSTANAMYNVTVVATVFDANDNAIAASQTLVTTLPAQGTAPLVFTWNTPFRAPAVRVEILPVTGP